MGANSSRNIPGPVRTGGWAVTVGSRALVLAFGTAFVVLVGVAVLVGRIGGWTARQVGGGVREMPTVPSRSQPSVTRAPPRVDRSIPDTSNQVAAWVWLVVAAVVAIIVYLLLRRAWDARRRISERRRLQVEPDPATGPQLDEEPPPPVPQTPPGRQFDARAAADAIVSCWVWVEDWAAARGRPRLSFETPTEFLDRVVGHRGPDTGETDTGETEGAMVRAAPVPSSTTVVAAQDDRAVDAAQRSAAARILLPLYQRARFDVAALDPESAVRARDAALIVCGKDPVDVP